MSSMVHYLISPHMAVIDIYTDKPPLSQNVFCYNVKYGALPYFTTDGCYWHIYWQTTLIAKRFLLQCQVWCTTLFHHTRLLFLLPNLTSLWLNSESFARSCIYFIFQTVLHKFEYSTIINMSHWKVTFAFITHPGRDQVLKTCHIRVYWEYSQQNWSLTCSGPCKDTMVKENAL